MMAYEVGKAPDERAALILKVDLRTRLLQSRCILLLEPQVYAPFFPEIDGTSTAIRPLQIVKCFHVIIGQLSNRIVGLDTFYLLVSSTHNARTRMIQTCIATLS